MQTISSCPVCEGRTFTHFLDCKDYTVSHETFSLHKCDGCSLVVTSPQPAPEQLSRYYESAHYISHTTRATSFFDKLYAGVRYINIRWKLALIRRTNPGSPLALLDYGSGTGEFLRAAANAGYRIAGVEPSQKARIYANSITNNTVLESLAGIPQEFDVITLWHVLEHVPDLNETFAQLKNRLRKNGTMFIAVPNHLSADAKRYRHCWAGYDVPRHLWHFNQQSMARFLNKHALTLTQTVPMKLDAFYLSLLSEQYRKGKPGITAWVKGIAAGVRSNLSAARRENNYSSLIYIATK